MVIVGKVVSLPVVGTDMNGSEITVISIEVDRAFKNSRGEYETDLIPVILWQAIAKSAIEQCSIGSLVGIKGRLEAVVDASGKNAVVVGVNVIAEKVSFLTTK